MSVHPWSPRGEVFPFQQALDNRNKEREIRLKERLAAAAAITPCFDATTTLNCTLITGYGYNERHPHVPEAEIKAMLEKQTTAICEGALNPPKRATVARIITFEAK